jgi:hypothetical protein
MADHLQGFAIGCQRGGPVLKNFLRPKFTDFSNKLVFVPGKPFQPCLMFVGKAGAYPSETPFRGSTIGYSQYFLR